MPADLVGEAGRDAAELGEVGRARRLRLEAAAALDEPQDEAVGEGDEEQGRAGHQTGLPDEPPPEPADPPFELQRAHAEPQGAHRPDRHRDVEGALPLLAVHLDRRRAAGPGSGRLPAERLLRRHRDRQLGASAQHQDPVLVADLDRLHQLPLAQDRVDVGLGLLLHRERGEEVTGHLRPPREPPGEPFGLLAGLEEHPFDLPLGEGPEGEPAEQGDVEEEEGPEQQGNGEEPPGQAGSGHPLHGKEDSRTAGECGGESRQDHESFVGRFCRSRE